MISDELRENIRALIPKAIEYQTSKNIQYIRTQSQFPDIEEKRAQLNAQNFVHNIIAHFPVDDIIESLQSMITHHTVYPANTHIEKNLKI